MVVTMGIAAAAAHLPLQSEEPSSFSSAHKRVLGVGDSLFHGQGQGGSERRHDNVGVGLRFEPGPQSWWSRDWVLNSYLEKSCPGGHSWAGMWNPQGSQPEPKACRAGLSIFSSILQMWKLMLSPVTGRLDTTLPLHSLWLW